MLDPTLESTCEGEKFNGYLAKSVVRNLPRDTMKTMIDPSMCAGYAPNTTEGSIDG